MKKIIIPFMLFSCYFGCAQEFTPPITLQIVNTQNELGEKSANYNTDMIGQWHNEALTFTLSKLANAKFDVKDPNFAQLYATSIAEFCQTKGIDVNVRFDGDFSKFQAYAKTNMCDISDGLSVAGKNIICEVNSKISDFVNERQSLTSFNASIESIRQQCESLPDEIERKICGITAATAKHSIQFWNDNFDYYYNVFKSKSNGSSHIDNDKGSGPSNENYGISRDEFKIRWWAVGASDALGAWRWGTVGAAAAGGVPGAVAGGLAGGAAHSLGSLISQAIISLF